MKAHVETLNGETIRRLLRRRDLALARHHAALERRLGLTGNEMLAIAYLAQHDKLTPSRLAALVDLSSGGVSALVQRLERRGHVTRHPHPTDGRSWLIRLTPGTAARMQGADARVIEELARVAAGLAEHEQRAIAGFLQRVAELGEELVDATRREGEPRTGIHVSPVPSLWA